LTLQIYHGRSVNARLTFIGRAQRSIGRIGQAGGLPHRQPGSLAVATSTVICEFQVCWLTELSMSTEDDVMG
jgi:hypothetical protein